MLELKDIKSGIVREIFPGREFSQSGEVYEALCSSFPLRKIKNKKHHKVAMKAIRMLMEFLSKKDFSRSIEEEVLQYLETLALLVADFEKKHFLLDRHKVTGEEILEFLMEQHDLKQSDLKKELGSQSVVSELLSGKRKLNKRQIQALSKRFHVSPSVFF